MKLANTSRSFQTSFRLGKSNCFAKAWPQDVRSPEFSAEIMEDLFSEGHETLGFRAFPSGTCWNSACGKGYLSPTELWMLFIWTAYCEWCPHRGAIEQATSHWFYWISFGFQTTLIPPDILLPNYCAERFLRSHANHHCAERFLRSHAYHLAKFRRACPEKGLYDLSANVEKRRRVELKDRTEISSTILFPRFFLFKWHFMTGLCHASQLARSSGHLPHLIYKQEALVIKSLLYYHINV